MNKNIVHEIGNYLQQIISNAEHISEHSQMFLYSDKIKNIAYKIDALITDSTVEKPLINMNNKITKVFDFKYFNGKKILIVDDIRENITIMENIFLTLSCKIESVLSGEDALKLYKNGYRPEIVCMDMIMPGIDGFITTQELKLLGCDAYFIAISALKNQSHDTVSIFDVWLQKPFTFEHIIGALSGYYHKVDSKKIEIYRLDSEISTEYKNKILELSQKGAYSELLRLLATLPSSASKEFLTQSLKEMKFDAIIKSIISS